MGDGLLKLRTELRQVKTRIEPFELLPGVVGLVARERIDDCLAYPTSVLCPPWVRNPLSVLTIQDRNNL